MKNKFISAVLTAAILLGMCCTVGAASNTSNYDEDNAAILSKTLGIMVGDDDGNMHLDSFVSRAEFTKIAVAMSAYRNMVPAGGTTSVFRDCTYRHWASPYVRVAVTNGLMTGYPDGTFRPDSTVLFEEAVTVMLKLLGYTSDDFGTSWPYGQVGIAANIHVTDNINCTVGSELSRGDVLKLIYNTLIAQPKDSPSEKYLQKLDCNLYEDAVIIATNEQNNSVTPGYVLTSAGTFKVSESLDSDIIGRRGDLIVKNSNEYAAFMKAAQTSEKHVVYSKLDDSVITYYDGVVTSFKIDDNVTAYSDTNQTTYGSVKSTLSTGDVIYLVKDAAGKVDYITVTTDSLEGPYTVSGPSGLDSLGISEDGLTVMRDGVKADKSDICANDIVYYLKDTKTVFAYSRKITGIYEKASPNRDMPTSVTVSGTTYTIETAAAFDKLSSNGNLKYGDTVTLLIGKDGQIADVVTSSSGETIVGYLTETGTKRFENSDGEAYTAMYAGLICPDGTSLEVVTDRNYSSYINKVMSVNFNNGAAALTAVKAGGAVSGTVDAENMKIGLTSVDESVEILDVSTNNGDDPGAYVRVYMQRLDGMNLSSSKVLYSETNDRGEITGMILLNATGDSYSYGIVTKKSETTSGGGQFSTTNRSYTCDIDGSTYVCNLNYGGLIGSNTAAGFIVSNGQVVSIVKLISAGSVSSIGDGYVNIGGKQYLVSDKAAVYKSDIISGTSTYTVMPLNELKNSISSYAVTAYCDKNQSSGGRIRVLIAREK